MRTVEKDVDLGMVSPPSVDPWRKPLRQDGRQRADAQAARQLAPLQFRTGQPKTLERLGATGVIDPPGLGQSQALAFLGKQAYADRVLQLLDLLTHGARRYTQPPRGFHHALRAPEGVEHLQCAQRR